MTQLSDHPPGSPQNDGRSPFASAMEWSSRITGIALEMVLPGLAGYWLDQRLGTFVLFLILGVILGFVTAMLSLLRLAKPPRSDRPPD